MEEPHDILSLSRESHKMDIQKADDYTLRRLARIAGMVSGKVVLDIGCGCGLLHKNLGEEMTYIGVDFVKESLIDAKWLGSSSAHRAVATAHALPIKDKSIQAVVCSEVLEHLPYDLPRICLSEAFRVLKESGTMILSVPNFSHLSNRLYFLVRGRIRGLSDVLHVNSFTSSSLEDLLRTVGFKIMERHGFDVVLEPHGLLAHLAFRVPYIVRKRIADAIPILDQLIVLEVSKESSDEGSLSPAP